MWDNLIPGLAGGLVVAVITNGINYLLAVRKEKVEKAKDAVSRSFDLMTAARLIEGV